MKIALLTVLRNDMLEHFKAAKEYGLDIDVMIRSNERPCRRAYIKANNLNERIYTDANLFDILKEYDVISTYEFYGILQAKLMPKFDNIIPECAWNVPTYGTYYHFDNWHAKCLTLAKLKVKAFIARSQSVYNAMVQEGIQEDRIHLLHGGCDTSLFKPRPKPEELKDNLVFLFIGRCQEQKGIFEIFHSFYRANIPNSKLIYLGSPHPTNPWDYSLVKEWATTLGISDKVIFYKGVPPEEVHNYFNWGDIFISLPNTDIKYVEQIGLTAPQALASGLPVITYDYGGQSDFVDPSCGIKIHHKDYVAGATAMISLTNKNFREKMSKAARAKAVEQYDVHTYAQEIKAVYEKGLV